MRLDRATVRARLAATPALLATAARAAEHADAAGEWSATEVVRHLIAVEEQVWLPRLRQMADEPNPDWSWTEPGLGDGEGTSLAVLLALFRYRRRRTLDWLDDLDDAGWYRVGTHTTYGILDVVGLMEVALDHDVGHLGELERRARSAPRSQELKPEPGP